MLSFLPYQIASVGIACILVQAFCRHKLVDAIKNQTGAIFLYSFIGLEFIVTILHSNWNGFGNTWLFVLVGLYGAYYRKSITKSTFEKMCDLIIILSILFSDWFSIHGFIGESKWFFDFYACFCVFLCIFSYFYAFIFIFMHCYAFLLL